MQTGQSLFAGFRDKMSRRRWRKAIGLYLTRLPGLLAKDYGSLGPYTPAQVRRATERHALGDGTFIPYALVIFCDRDDVEPLVVESNYDRLRTEIADAFFGGDLDFKVKAVRYFSDNWGSPDAIEGMPGIRGANPGWWGGQGGGFG